ncbi:BRCT domain-containing protein At4g02110-like isoform X1 [Mangifera indica]|uniref:BRCT domain-containing protein At4g02110-like isoform X1 n=1 Tax=Mangifera indica TaxID=29780 RepID=UPI001CFAE59D|nr:BRCT domain-containing protein At4g02110-like isoform X1 [Mangifera indica]
MELCSDSQFSGHSQSEVRFIRGMDSVVATVSGYNGSERFNLIKLISETGASYVGAMSRSTTHLVCWKFEGKKFDLAKKFKTIIVNHRWVEDCIKQRKRVPEAPYMLQCGRELGPLSLELPIVIKKHSVFSDKSYHRLGDYEKEDVMDSEGADLAAWTDSFLLDENFLLKFEKRNDNSQKSKAKPLKRTSRKEKQSSVRYCFQEPPLSGSVSMEYGESSSDSSMHSTRGKRKISKHHEPSTSCLRSEREKRKISMDISTTLAKPSGKGRRLLKKNIGENFLESTLSDSDLEGNLIIRTGGTSNDRFHQLGEIDEGFQDSQDILERNHSHGLDRILSNGCSDFENLNGHVKDADQTEHVNRLPTSMELSCVICWTEFSSTRGILPCGHRFCYSCIQNWADHMASMRKISTCPLCKASFVSITKVEDADTCDQKIYSQTVPCAQPRMDIFFVTDQDRTSIGAQPSLLPSCSECRSREPEELLVRCHLCQIRCIHSYCLDPPLFPWTCIHCKDLQMLYLHSY